FRRNFRISRSTANKIIEGFANSSHFKQKLQSGGKMACNPETQCMVLLWFAGNKTTYREVANLFNISLSSVHRYMSFVT
ncbi:hypothetical protein ACXWRC_09275, partial [Streptococcus pyogenes]